MKLSDFIKIFPLRSKNISWFLGAGASASAGIPTAYDMIWDFKRQIYCAEENLKIDDYSNISNSMVREKIQSYFELIDGTPLLNSSEEYSYYFEKLFSMESDRAEYIRRMLANYKPSYGHKVLAVLMKMEELNCVVTSNFDKSIENAAALIYKNTDSLIISSVDNNISAISYLQERKFPLLIKIHGDYHSTSLKNTSDELQKQDKHLRAALKQLCMQQGLAVMGYSGRDNSIMEIFEESINEPYAFPKGLFWFNKSDSPILSRVQKLIETAKEKGIEAEIVDSETFDDTFSSLIKSFHSIPSELQIILDSTRDRLIIKPLPEVGKYFPIIRLNALPILEFPSIARLINCNIGGDKELNQVIESSKARVLAIRKKEGVIGFGSDSEFDKALSNYEIESKSIYQITEKPFIYSESKIKDLVLTALCTALCKDNKLKHGKRGPSNFIFPNFKLIDDIRFKALQDLKYKSYGKEESHQIIGSIPKTKLKWIDAIKISFSYNFSNLYLILNPTILAQKSEDINLQYIAAAFIKEKMAQRLNEGYNSILDAWIKTLFPGSDEKNEIFLEAFDEISGLNASFKILCKTTFSRKK